MWLFRCSWISLLPALFSPILLAQLTEYQGQTASGAYYRLVVPDQWQPQDGLVIWNHGYQGYTATGPESSPFPWTT